MRAEFPYQEEDSQLFGKIMRPLIDIEIFTNEGWIPVLAYVDSGADISLLPRSWAEVLGVKFEKEKIREIRGIGEAIISVVVKEIEIKINNKTVKGRAAIAMIEEVPYILGRQDFFEPFRICFEQKERRIIFEVV